MIIEDLHTEYEKDQNQDYQLPDNYNGFYKTQNEYNGYENTSKSNNKR